MFSTCVHCQQRLDRNDSIERFPIGRRIAFDGARGRLWAVCGKCERWNLSPIEERWEAIEECERQFRDTRVRVSTDNIGLARLRDGTELVRIGKPMRPEFAAWRYGDQFGRRRRRHALYVGSAVLGGGALIAGGAAAGLTAAAATQLVQLANLGHSLSHRYNLFGKRQPSCVRLQNGCWFELGRYGEPLFENRDDTPGGWGVKVGGFEHVAPPSAMKPWPIGPFRVTVPDSTTTSNLQLHGEDAEAVMRDALRRSNRWGASLRRVKESVALIEGVGDPARFGAWIAEQRPVWRAKMTFVDNDGRLKAMPPAARLAFEMALHEDSERRALEGELHLLEAAWRDADAIARIADDMFVPAAVDARIDALRNDTA